MARAGEYRHRFRIEQKTIVRNPSGQPKETWAAFATRWAKIEDVAGMQRWRAEQYSEEVTHEVTLRSHLAGVTSQMRGVHRGRVFHIDAVRNPRERSIQTVLHCTERPDQDG